MRKTILKIILGVLVVIFLVSLYVAVRIITYSDESYPVGDSAIVLGAAIWTDEPSPVFEARIDHAMDLYHANAISKIYFTGGVGEGEKWSEAEVAEMYAVGKGVSESDVVIEKTSHTTLQNLENISGFIGENEKVLIVTDPLHAWRAVMMARDLGLDAYPAPTPYTRYISFKSKAEFLVREVDFIFLYKLWGM